MKERPLTLTPLPCVQGRGDGSLWARLTKRKAPAPEKMFSLIRGVIEGETDFTNVRAED